MNLSNTKAPVVLVTGAARRVGATIARYFHRHHYHVIIHYHRSYQEANELSHALNQLQPESALVLTADLTQKASCSQLIQQAVNWKGHLNAVINNASVFLKTNLAKPCDEDWHTLFATNVLAPFWLSLAAYPYLAEQEGIIINLTDIHADKPLKEYTAYCQSKAALKMQTESLARELAPKVRVNAIAPGAIIWPEHTNALSQSAQEKIIAATPLKRHGTPEDIAQAAYCLAENRFMTGQTIRVDGGRSLT